MLITCLESEQADARETAHWVFDAGRRAVTVAVELRDEQHCGEVIDRTVQEFGQIDVCTATWPSDVAGRRARWRHQRAVRPGD